MDAAKSQKLLAENLESVLDEATEKGLWLYHDATGAWYSVYEMRELIRKKSLPPFPAREYQLCNVVEHVDQLEEKCRKCYEDFLNAGVAYNNFIFRVMGDPDTPIPKGVGCVSIESVVENLRGNASR